MTLLSDSCYTGNQLKSITDRYADIIIKAEAEIICGESANVYCANGVTNILKTFSFQSGSKLREIQQFSFYNCIALLSIDLSSCSLLTTIGNQAFSGCTNVTTLKLPDSVQSIGEKCFQKLKITSVNYPPLIKIANQQSFSDITTLTTINFPSNTQLATISSNAFSGCGLTSFTIPKTVTEFNGLAFSQISTLKTIHVDPANAKYASTGTAVYSPNNMIIYYVASDSGSEFTIPDTVQYIWQAAFFSSKCTSVTIPSGVKEIKNYCFATSSIQSLVIPDSCTAIGTQAFYGCKSLSSITLSKNIKSIPDYCFFQTNLAEIRIPDSVTYIGSSALAYCANLVNVYLPINISLGGSVFGSSPKINLIFNGDSIKLNDQYILIDKDETTISQFFGTDAIIYLPSTVRSIKSQAFTGKNMIQKLICNSTSSIEEIGEYAFSGCYTLVSIPNFPNLKTIGKYAFYMTALKDRFSFGSQLTSLNESCFYGCKAITSVSFSSSSPLSIGDSCFMECSNLVSVSFPTSTTFTLGSSAFENDVSLNAVYLPLSMLLMGARCFFNTGLTSVTFENSKINSAEIPSQWFSDCSKLTAFEIPTNAARLGVECLKNTSITSITIPDSLITLSMHCFLDCQNLEEITIHDESKLSEIEYGVFAGCLRFRNISQFTSVNFLTENGILYSSDRTKLIVYPPASPNKYVAISDKVRTIKQSTFIGCVNIESIMIPDNSVTSIKNNAFEGCSNLKVFNIPKCVNSIGENAFLGCNSLSCGILYENKTKQFKLALINAGINARALEACHEITCKVRNSRSSMSFFYHVFILMYL
ncbi:surface antigen BspA-like [Trichomonas vaginalis G3]|uniref:Surface antigen BspA-like n=1 Tax=Trichomonas vaginalis (strain ATCC PRA-98 / G3) TaxID=412133 RepID=A2EEJ5_TRIV3|nr:surface antigen family [Trichomonas vaginalis G3]EAY08902.1 surface antigen BspA-like [Trichomonas vaginalis G3]KAI5494378.1 surface antigen family [Trichomonas vaginalis G3]|eukprot:XP_001321125.1 surface antigen BspA-like [Trichomonas vaginalis G3]